MPKFKHFYFKYICENEKCAKNKGKKTTHPWLVKLSNSNLPGRTKYFNRGSIQPKKCLGADGLGDFSYCHNTKSAVCLQNTL